MPVDPKAKIMEVFYSIQGEGPYAGVPQVFVRFFECNMHCSWCDTPASIGDTTRNFKELGLEELLDRVRSSDEGAHSMSITGGEPLLQVDFLKVFLPRLKSEGKRVYLETNGILPKELQQVIDWVDIVAMDIKLPSSTGEKAYWLEHEEFLRVAARGEVFIKAVISDSTVDEDVARAVEIVRGVDPRTLFILQPNYFDMKESGACVAKCVELQKFCSKTLLDVRITPQMHKFMKLR